MKDKNDKPRKKKDDRKVKVEPKVEHATFCGNEYRGIIRSVVPLGPRYFDGVGKYVWKGGTVSYEGPFVKSNIEGSGVFSWDSGKVSYTGDVHNGQRHGNGVLLLADGTKYEGQWHLGRRHGSGKLLFPSGSYYDGEWENDRKHGEGHQTWCGKDGNSYTGQWNMGHMSGHGRMVWKREDKSREEYVSGSSPTPWHKGEAFTRGLLLRHRNLQRIIMPRQATRRNK